MSLTLRLLLREIVRDEVPEHISLLLLSFLSCVRRECIPLCNSLMLDLRDLTLANCLRVLRREQRSDDEIPEEMALLG